MAPEVIPPVPKNSNCELCMAKHSEDHWIDVGPEGEGISLVTVDVTLRLCQLHRARLLAALSREDADVIDPPREMKGWGASR